MSGAPQPTDFRLGVAHLHADTVRRGPHVGQYGGSVRLDDQLSYI